MTRAKMSLVTLLISILVVEILIGCGFISAFSLIPGSMMRQGMATNSAFRRIDSICLMSTKQKGPNRPLAAEEDGNSPMPDDELINMVPKSRFQELCGNLNLSTEGTKQELLARLRQHANQQASLDKQRHMERKRRVEEGISDDERERHEIVDGGIQFGTVGASLSDFQCDDEEEGYFYFELKSDDDDKRKAQGNQKTTNTNAKQKKVLTQTDVLAAPPPPHGTALNANGERVVTVYSTTDHNDLTGVAAAQPGQAAFSGTDPMAAGSASSGSQPWDRDHQTTNKKATSRELEAAKEKITELIQTLLSMTGIPGFQHFDIPEELEYLVQRKDDDQVDSPFSTTSYGSDGQKASKIGFDPSKVPAHLLTEASQALRASRGRVLLDVLREFELHAVGQDGRAGDNVEDGGGHFREVSKVRAFLEGFRRAEVRKAARMTVTILLDKLVSEGVEGLDLCLATMARSNDDSSNEADAYELNDSLISYLNDIIREQEKKTEQLRNSANIGEWPEAISNPRHAAEDPVNQLWNHTTGKGGETIETIDPSDPKVLKVLETAYELANIDQPSSNDSVLGQREPIPETAPEKILLLLKLLRERIRTEAAFANDDRSRFLRLLAYCLKCSSDASREELILKDLGSSIDKLDTFKELVTSAIEYAESTSHQLHPAKHVPLNFRLLKRILTQAETIRERQAWKAGGLRP